MQAEEELQDLLWVPQRDSVVPWATVTSPCLFQVGSGASFVLPLQGADGEILSSLLTFLLP